MRAELLLLFVGVTLCCTPVWAQHDPDEKRVSRDPARVREAGGTLVEEGQEGVEMSDQPAEVKEDNKAKPKKKKTPEEIEAGTCSSGGGTHLNAGDTVEVQNSRVHIFIKFNLSKYVLLQ